MTLIDDVTREALALEVDFSLPTLRATTRRPRLPDAHGLPQVDRKPTYSTIIRGLNLGSQVTSSSSAVAHAEIVGK
jgi:hypothetical protein